MTTGHSEREGEGGRGREGEEEKVRGREREGEGEGGKGRERKRKGRGHNNYNIIHTPLSITLHPSKQFNTVRLTPGGSLHHLCPATAQHIDNGCLPSTGTSSSHNTKADTKVDEEDLLCNRR